MSWLPTMEEQGAAAAIKRLVEKRIPFNRGSLEPKPNEERAKAKEPEQEIEEISSTSEEESTPTPTPDSQYLETWIEEMWETVEEPKEKHQKEMNRDSSQQENKMQKRKSAELGQGELLKRAIHAASVQPKPRAHPKASAASKAVPPSST